MASFALRDVAQDTDFATWRGRRGRWMRRNEQEIMMLGRAVNFILFFLLSEWRAMLHILYVMRLSLEVGRSLTSATSQSYIDTMWRYSRWSRSILDARRLGTHKTCEVVKHVKFERLNLRLREFDTTVTMTALAAHMTFSSFFGPRNVPQPECTVDYLLARLPARLLTLLFKE